MHKEYPILTVSYADLEDVCSETEDEYYLELGKKLTDEQWQQVANNMLPILWDGDAYGQALLDALDLVKRGKSL